MKIVGIDIGYYNLGMVLAECDGANVDVLYVRKIDLTDYKTQETPELSDMIHEFVMAHSDIFSQADQVLIERQPPGGISSVEVLLHYIFRHKAVLISPVSMHAHFNIGHLDYEQRKVRTESTASKYIKGSEYYERLHRKHDIADALCMILFQNYKNGLQFKRTTIAQSGIFEEYLFK
jgi:hypothetical protein